MYNFTKNDPFNAQEIEALRQRLAQMDQVALTRFYNSSLHLCMLDRQRPPRAHFVQQFVQAWKEMTKRAQESDNVFQLQAPPTTVSAKPKKMARAGERSRVLSKHTGGLSREGSNPSTIPA